MNQEYSDIHRCAYFDLSDGPALHALVGAVGVPQLQYSSGCTAGQGPPAPR